VMCDVVAVVHDETSVASNSSPIKGPQIVGKDGLNPGTWIMMFQDEMASMTHAMIMGIGYGPYQSDTYQH
jgi:hypothetical protein